MAVLRPLRRGDADGVRALFVATAGLGRPLRLPDTDLRAYTSLCLDYYLDHDGSACAVLEEAGTVVGYAMVALDHAAYSRWATPKALRWFGRALVGLPRRAAAREGRVLPRFYGLRALDGVIGAVSASPPQPAHFHFNVEGARRGVRAGFELAGHADRVVAAAGLPGYFGEVNVPRDKPGRAAALERLGVQIVHRQRNHTLSWLAARPVDRLTVTRPLATATPLSGAIGA